MWRHSSSKAKGKRKQDEGSSSSSQVQSDTSASLFAIIVSFPFIFIYTFSFEFTIMFYLVYVMFLFVGHSGLSVVTGAASWGIARPEAALDSCTTDGRRDRGGSSRGGGSCGAGCPRGARDPRGGSWGAWGVIVWGRWRGGFPTGGRPTAAAVDQLHVSWILILFRFIFYMK
jgi:hypothetical protein